MSAPAHTLLAQALRTLTDEEQGIVLSTLLSATGPRVDAASYRRVVADRWRGAVPITDEQPLDKVGFLLRLPSGTHQALKVWADENGHSMNVVVRGLVERFLEDQGRPPGPVQPEAHP